MTVQVSKDSNDQSLKRMTAASIDHRCHNVRYRQNQIHLLHAFLRQNIEQICSAIQQDSDITESEALSEYLFAISALSQLYDELDFDEALRDEYSIATRESNINRRSPYGIAVIKPGNFSRFFSVIAPLVAAMAAGNCVLVELPNTLKRVDEIIKQAITRLDHDAFIVTSSPVTDERFLSYCLVINENGTVIPPGHPTHSANRKPNVAIIHRDANIQAAARSLCNARLRFHGCSPYAPDVILVNEWVKNDFIEACLQLINKEDVKTSSNRGPMVDLGTSSKLNTISSTNTVDHFCSTSDIQLKEIKDRNVITTLKTVQGRTLTILSVTSLIDSVSIAAQIPSIFACYAFASLPNAKYLCQQVDSSISFVNEIPIQVLVGPAVPKASYNSNSDLRYDTSMMSKPHPEYLNTELASYRLVKEIFEEGTIPRSQKESNIKAIKRQATSPLKPTGQASGTSMGFFDQGILTGVIAFVLPTICLASVGVVYAAKYAYRRYY